MLIRLIAVATAPLVPLLLVASNLVAQGCPPSWYGGGGTPVSTPVPGPGPVPAHGYRRGGGGTPNAPPVGGGTTGAPPPGGATPGLPANQGGTTPTPVGGGAPPAPNPGGAPPPAAPAPGGGPAAGGGAPAPAGGTTPRPAGATSRLPNPGGRGVRSPLTRRSVAARKRAAAPKLDWEMWWSLNKWEYLHANELLRRRATESPDRSQDLGSLEGIELLVRGLPEAVLADDVLPALRRALQDRYADNRLAATVALGKTQAPAAIAPLFQSLRDDNAFVRQSAVIALGMLRQGQAVSYLAEIMRGSPQGARLMRRDRVSAGTRRHAALALGLTRKPAALKELLAAVDEEDAPFTTFVVSGLGVLGDRGAVPVLCRLITAPKTDPRIRQAACVALGKLGDRGPVVLRVLQQTLGEKSLGVARSAAVALGALAQPEDASVLASLEKTVRDHSDVVARALALMAISRVGGERAWAVSLDSMGTRGLVGGYAPLALAFAAKSVVSSDGDAARQTRARSLIRRHGRRAKDESVRRACWLALGLLGSPADTDALAKIAKSTASPRERATAVAALGLIGDAPSVALFEELLDSRVHDAIRGEAAVALGMTGDRRESTARIAAVLDGARNNWLRACCALALGLLDDAEGVPELARMCVGVDVPGDTRAFASGALGLLSEPDDLPVLYRYRADNVFWVDVPDMRRLLMQL